MACFIAPASVAVITTSLKNKFPKNLHINWLNTMIWGGSAALAVEHISHEEIVPWFPFLTAMSNPTDTIVMLKEIASVGIPMTIALVLAWAVMVVVYENFIAAEKSPLASPNSTK
jgi:hypothetical protein